MSTSIRYEVEPKVTTCGFPCALWSSAYMLALIYDEKRTQTTLMREANKLLRSKTYFEEKFENADKMSMILQKSCFYAVTEYHQNKGSSS